MKKLIAILLIIAILITPTLIFADGTTLFFSDEGMIGVNTVNPNSTLDINGSVGFIRHNYRSSATDNLTLTSDHCIVRFDCTSDNVTIYLPSIYGSVDNDACEGRLYIIKKIDSSANTITVIPHDGNYIEGETSVVLSEQWEVLTIYSETYSWERW